MSPIDPFSLSLELASVASRPGDWFLSPGYNGPVFSKMPYVFTVHDLNHIDRVENSSVAKRVYYRTVMGRLCRRARAVLTVSEFSKVRLVDWFGLDPRRVFNVGNGVSRAFVPVGRNDQLEAQYVLCVSNRRGHKNERRLLTAFASSCMPRDVSLMFTGNADAEIVQIVADLGLTSRVSFSGPLEEEQLAQLYRGAVFMVFPSLYEGFGLPVVEAFASGIPVITSNVTALPEIAGGAALLVDPLDVDAIAEAMGTLYASKERRGELSRLGIERARAFTWESVVERVRHAITSANRDSLVPLEW